MAPPPPSEPHGITTLFGPIQMLFLSTYYIPITLINLVKTFQFSKLTSWPAFQHAWFGEFWRYFGPLSRENAEHAVRPLLQSAEGVVLDIGPGSGEWVNLFAQNSGITKIFGVEPNYEHHAMLRRRIAQAGLQDVYEILGVGAEDLATCGLALESVDTICTVQCLCSVPGPQKIIKDLFPYLKSGGRWLAYEHVKTKYQDDFVGHWQRLIDRVWPYFFDGCSITRPTDEWLLTAGDWKSVALKSGEGEGKYDTVPHVIGTLVKR